MENCKCKKCGHFWVSQKGDPQQCPRCKRYDWKIDLGKLRKLDRKNLK
jgi:Zn finger protein HypA/HybF involved in hydrogenase expression